MWYKTPGLGFNFETCRTQSILPAANHSNVCRRDLQFVMSQIQENSLVIQTSRSLYFLRRAFFKRNISLWSELWDLSFMPKHKHYTLTTIQEVKRHNRTPFNMCFFLWARAEGFDPLSWETLCPNVSLRAVSDRLSCYVSLSLLASSSEVTTSLSTHWFIWGGWNPILRPRAVRMCFFRWKRLKKRALH